LLERTLTSDDAAELAGRLRAGDRRALSRAISEVENETAAGLALFKRLYPISGRAHWVGITGSAGAGKSTLTAALASAYRKTHQTVGVIAVDPSSPYTRGALLGDRIRMQALSGDEGIFVRSMATRGSTGGLANMAAEVATVLDAAGYDLVLIETVGAGQDEVEVARVAHTTLVLSTPGMGDGIQAIKAGIIEIADVLVVNKGDLPGAEAVEAQLRAMLDLAPAGDWNTPVVRVSATAEAGIDSLVNAIEQHRLYLGSNATSTDVKRQRARQRILSAAQAELSRQVLQREAAVSVENLVDRVADHSIDPRSAAIDLLGRLGVVKANAN
jgi:LAO/AO transport system kinase